MDKLKLGVLISGRGSNLQALIDACADPGYPAEIVLVISNRPDAGGLARTQATDIATRVIEHTNYEDRESFDRDVDAALRDAGAQLICLAGFMRLLSAWFVDQWPDRIVNIHPSLLPAFKGTDSHAQALAAGVKLTGCTVHFVRSEMDAGPIIMQAAVPVLYGDDEDSLAARVLTAEHQCYPRAVRLIAEGRITVEDSRATITDNLEAGPPLYNPPAD
ncbi:MAG: phosphoribosylglycinamide formyltransferase [Alphaproteobacteria bacterium]|nr:phosphoribosylglycinamide formyltransferase [Alphaproteobacteria bacterium]